jgi:hypothetical protein
MQRLDTRKITLSGITLFPTESSPFQASLILNDVPLAPSMGSWYTGVYGYESPRGSWDQILLDEELQPLGVQLRIDGGSEEYGFKWRIGLNIFTENFGYSQSFTILEQSGDEVYENPWMVPLWNLVIPDVEDEDYPWTDYLTLDGESFIAPVDEGSFTLPYKGLSAIEVLDAEPDTFYTSIAETRTFVLSGTYLFNEEVGTYVHTNPANTMDAGQALTLYFDYDLDTEGQPAGLDARIYKIEGPGSTSTVAELAYLPYVLDYADDLSDVQISDWSMIEINGMTLLGLGGNEEPEQPSQNTFGLPTESVALISKNFGSVENFLRLRNQGQV